MTTSNEIQERYSFSVLKVIEINIKDKTPALCFPFCYSGLHERNHSISMRFFLTSN